jgi:hypothetical protein
VKFCPVTAEAAGSSPVVPAIHSKRVALISPKPTRTQKGRILRPFCVPFFVPQSLRARYLTALSCSAKTLNNAAHELSIRRAREQVASDAAARLLRTVDARDVAAGMLALRKSPSRAEIREAHAFILPVTFLRFATQTN